MSVSPDGANLAYIRRDSTGACIIAQARSGEVLATVESGESRVRGVSWVLNDHVLISSTSNQNLGNFRGRNMFGIVDILNVRTASVVRGLRDAELPVYNMVFSADRAVRGGRPALVVAGLTTHEAEYTNDLYALDLNTGRGRRIAKGQSDTLDWLVDPDGEPLARTAYHEESGRWRLSVPGSLGWSEVRNLQALLDTPAMLGVGRTPGTLLIREDGENGERVLNELNVATSAETPLELPGHINDVVHGADGRLVGLGYTDQFQSYQFFEPKLQMAWDTLSRALPGRQLVLQSFSDDFDEVVFHISGSGEPGGYYLFDGAANRLSVVGREYPGIAPANMAEVRVIEYAASDGLEMMGYLTLPPGRAARNLPVIMMPHGGPAARDYAGFDWWAQAMAAQGYAVFQPNFRGSTGFGKAFLEAGYGQWGRKMQSDITDGLKALAAQGLVDPARACIVGASYGG